MNLYELHSTPKEFDFFLDDFIWFSCYKFDATDNPELADYSGCVKFIAISFLWFTLTIEYN